MELIRSNSGIPSGRSVPTDMPQPQAEQVLQAVVSTHERQVTLATPVEQACGYSYADIRAAAYSVSRGILGRPYPDDVVKGDSSTSKFTASGECHLFLWQVKEGAVTVPLGVSLEASQSYTEGILRGMRKPGLLKSEFRLSDFLRETTGIFTGYIDTRKHPERSVKLKEPMQITDDDYQFLFRGVRWLFANMLTWPESNIILPEALDRLSLHANTPAVTPPDKMLPANRALLPRPLRRG